MESRCATNDDLKINKDVGVVAFEGRLVTCYRRAESYKK